VGRSRRGLFRCVPRVLAIHLILCDTKCQVWHYDSSIHRSAVVGSCRTAQFARPCTVLHRTLPSNQNIDRHLGCDARALSRRYFTTHTIRVLVHRRTHVGITVVTSCEQSCVYPSACRASSCRISSTYFEKADSLRAGRSGRRIPMGSRFSLPAQTPIKFVPRLLSGGGGKAAGAWR
jgi:hypothetical protein